MYRKWQIQIQTTVRHAEAVEAYEDKEFLLGIFYD